mgnify:FL=1
MTEQRRQVIVDSCHKRLDNLQWYDENEIYTILSQAHFDKGVVKHALAVAYSFHEREEYEASLDEPV